MSNIERKEGSANKFRLVVPDPSAAGTGRRKRLVRTIEVEDVSLLKETPRAQQKLELFLNKELAKFEEEIEAGEFVRPERMTLEQFIPVWKKNYADKNMGKYTRKQAMYYINERVIPCFGHMRLDQIKTIHVVNFMSSLKRLPKPKKKAQEPLHAATEEPDKPLATNTLMNIYKALKSVLDAAHQWRLVARNPMDGVDRPKTGKREKREMRQRKKSYTKSETERVILGLRALSETWRLFFLGAMVGGFRRGENLAVEWPQVDFKRGGISVEKQITFDELGNVIEDEVKTEQSMDFVPLPWWYMEELAQFKREWNKEKLRCPKWEGGDKQYVFHSGNGVRYYPTTPTMTWGRFLKKYGLPRIRLHDLRHTSAMLLKASKVDTERIKRHMRHTKLSTTADMYMDEADIIDREAADQLEDLNPNVRHPSATRDAE